MIQSTSIVLWSFISPVWKRCSTQWINSKSRKHKTYVERNGHFHNFVTFNMKSDWTFQIQNQKMCWEGSFGTEFFKSFLSFINIMTTVHCFQGEDRGRHRTSKWGSWPRWEDSNMRLYRPNHAGNCHRKLCPKLTDTMIQTEVEITKKIAMGRKPVCISPSFQCDTMVTFSQKRLSTIKHFSWQSFKSRIVRKPYLEDIVPYYASRSAYVHSHVLVRQPTQVFTWMHPWAPPCALDH